MLIEKVLNVLADLETGGIIEKYAIGGGMASIAYVEPFLTYDLDVFVILPGKPRMLVSLTPIYEYLQKRGYKVDREHVLIGDVPVQFIPAYDALTKEAISSAAEMLYKGLRMKIFRLEHLVAIMLKTNRPKDIARIAEVLGRVKMDQVYFDDILTRHGLKGRWAALRKRLHEEK